MLNKQCKEIWYKLSILNICFNFHSARVIHILELELSITYESRSNTCQTASSTLIIKKTRSSCLCATLPTYFHTKWFILLRFLILCWFRVAPSILVLRWVRGKPAGLLVRSGQYILCWSLLAWTLVHLCPDLSRANLKLKDKR